MVTELVHREWTDLNECFAKYYLYLQLTVSDAHSRVWSSAIGCLSVKCTLGVVVDFPPSVFMSTVVHLLFWWVNRRVPCPFMTFTAGAWTLRQSVDSCLNLERTTWPLLTYQVGNNWHWVWLNLLQGSSSVWIWTSSPSSSTWCRRTKRRRKRRMRRGGGGGRPSPCTPCGLWPRWLKLQMAAASCWSSSPCWWGGAKLQRRTRTFGGPLKPPSGSSPGPPETLMTSDLQKTPSGSAWWDKK